MLSAQLRPACRRPRRAQLCLSLPEEVAAAGRDQDRCVYDPGGEHAVGHIPLHAPVHGAMIPEHCAGSLLAAYLRLPATNVTINGLRIGGATW